MIKICLIALTCTAAAAQIPAQIPVPGKTYWGKNGYVEYVAGSAPIVLAAPHGGYLKPAELKNRTWGVVAQDRRTQELAREVQRAVGRRTGTLPHLIICHLHRSKLDANREIREAAQGDTTAEESWREFHRFIDQAKATVVAQFGRGHFYDIHGHGHPTDWIELGYALSASDLAKSDATLRANSAFIRKATIRALVSKPGIDFPEALRGRTSLGGLLEARGYRSVPSPGDPSPKGKAYFTGGYNTRRHGSQSGGTIDGTQLEHSWPLRGSRVAHAKYARALAESVEDFFRRYHKLDLRAAPRIAVDALVAHAAERGRIGEFVLSRSGDLSSSESVRVLVEGTASEGTDFVALPRTVTFAATAATAVVPVRAIDDRRVEGWETVVLRIAGGKEIGLPARATVLIADDDGRPYVAADLALDARSGAVTKDASGNGRDAILVPSSSQGPRTVAGKRGSAMGFDGVNDGLRLRPFVYAPRPEFSIAFWFKARKKSSSSYRYLVSHGSFGKPESLHVYLAESTGTLKTFPVFRNARVRENVILDVAGDFFDDQWHHYALSITAGELARVFVDGQLRAEAFLAGDRFQPSGELFLGMRSDRSSNRFFLGELDDVRILSRAISNAEVRDIVAWSPGGVRTVGPGCRGSAGVPIHTVTGALDIGGDVVLDLAAAPASRPVLAMIGSSASSWNRVPLPIDFGPFGASGCALRVSVDLPTVLVTSSAGRTALVLRTPFDPALVGVRLFSQFLVFDPPANRLGLSVSEAREVRFGGLR